MKVRVNMIRHGITQGNAGRWIYGATEVPLMSEGIKEISRFKEQGIYPDADAHFYFTSGMIRTEQTFKLIYGDQGHRKLPALQEMNSGIFDGIPYEEVKNNPDFVEWMKDRTGNAIPEGGESFNQFIDRVNRGMDNLVDMLAREAKAIEDELRTPGEVTASCVCHGGVISAILYEKLGKPKGNHLYGWVPDPGRGFTLIYEDGDLIDFNDL